MAFAARLFNTVLVLILAIIAMPSALMFRWLPSAMQPRDPMVTGWLLNWAALSLTTTTVLTWFLSITIGWALLIGAGSGFVFIMMLFLCIAISFDYCGGKTFRMGESDS